MKKKFYTSLFWIGLAIASTTTYAKPHAHKHNHASAKSAKHVPSRNKLVSGNHFSKASNKPHRHKLRSIFTARHLDRRAPPSNVQTALEQKIHIGPILSANNYTERVHTYIAPHSAAPIISHTTDVATSSHITSVHGTLYSSLSAAGQKAGLSNELIFQLTNIFAWDIDFANDLHQGDQFTVAYETDPEGNTSIIAAEFVNQGRILTAMRYQDSEGQVNYYSPEGKPMRKAFLSSPVDYVRISSGFDTHRKHPILNRIRAHRGVDYAARTGTPVKSAGDGEVVFRGRRGGYGQVLIIKHGERYETLYAHLSDYKSGLNIGDQVKQGEVIGYVGQTGLATGPHLHYEFRVDGIHRNPEALNSAQASPLHGAELANFKAQTSPVLAQLNQTKAKSLFAKNQYEYN